MKYRSEVLLLIALVGLAGVLFSLRWALFPGSELHNEMWRFLLGDVAFLFLQVAIVTVCIDRLMRARERQATLRKLNMVIGAFFSEVGTELLKRLAQADQNLGELHKALVPSNAWKLADYNQARAFLVGHHAVMDLSACDLESIKQRLIAEKRFMLSLLGNQALLEHEAFAELLWAVTHLAEELAARSSLVGMPPNDVAHLAIDARRAYTHLCSQWLDYVRHLQTDYPFLFSLAVRTNPFDPEADAVVY
ncbi:MAG: hypothetical protein H6Q00_742 [Holophagaceae bacterium]|nr:hypothetical protein [Holophagaceae bacterium]